MFRKIVSTITLAAFLFTNTCLAADCLSASKAFDNGITKGTPYDKSYVPSEIVLKSYLKLMSPYIAAGTTDIQSIKDAYNKVVGILGDAERDRSKWPAIVPYFGAVTSVEEGVPIFKVQVSDNTDGKMRYRDFLFSSLGADQSGCLPTRVYSKEDAGAFKKWLAQKQKEGHIWKDTLEVIARSQIAALSYVSQHRFPLANYRIWYDKAKETQADLTLADLPKKEKNDRQSRRDLDELVARGYLVKHKDGGYVILPKFIGYCIEQEWKYFLANGELSGRYPVLESVRRRIKQLNLTIGVPKEIKKHAERVGLTPVGVKFLTLMECKVIVEHNAGKLAGFSDDDYRAARAEIVESTKDVWERSDLVKKVKEPLRRQDEEIDVNEFFLMKTGQKILTYFHLASPDCEELAETLIDRKKAAAIAYETVVKDGGTPMLKPMSIIAGRLGAYFAAIYIMGSRVTDEHNDKGERVVRPDEKTAGLWTYLKENYSRVAGKQALEPFRGKLSGKKAVILGGGTSGFEMATELLLMGAEVTTVEKYAERAKELERLFKGKHEGRVKIILAPDLLDGEIDNIPQDSELYKSLRGADILGGCMLKKGATAPRLSRDLMGNISKQKKKVLIDIAIDQKGNFTGSHTTYYDKPAFLGLFQNTYFSVANMPDFVGGYASLELEKTTVAQTLGFALGFNWAMMAFPELIGGVNTFEGQLCNPDLKDVYPRFPYYDFKTVYESRIKEYAQRLAGFPQPTAAGSQPGRPPVPGGSAVDALMIFGKNPETFLTENGFSVEDHKTAVESMGFTPAPSTLSDDRTKLMKAGYLERQAEGSKTRYVLMPDGLLAVLWLLDHERHEKALADIYDGTKAHSVWECVRLRGEVALTDAGKEAADRGYRTWQVINGRKDFDFDEYQKIHPLPEFKLAIPLKSAVFKFDDYAIRRSGPAETDITAAARMGDEGSDELDEILVIPITEFEDETPPKILPEKLKKSLLMAVQTKILEIEAASTHARPDIEARHRAWTEELNRLEDAIKGVEDEFSIEKAVRGVEVNGEIKIKPCPDFVRIARFALGHHRTESDWGAVCKALNEAEAAMKRGGAARMSAKDAGVEDVVPPSAAASDVMSIVTVRDAFKGADKGRLARIAAIFERIKEKADLVSTEELAVHNPAAAIDSNKMGVVPRETLSYLAVAGVAKDYTRTIGVYKTCLEVMERLESLGAGSGWAQFCGEIIEALEWAIVYHEIGHSMRKGSGAHNIQDMLKADKDPAAKKFLEETAAALHMGKGQFETDLDFATRVAEVLADSCMGGSWGDPFEIPPSRDYIKNKGAYLFYKLITKGASLEELIAPSGYIRNGAVDEGAIRGFVNKYYADYPEFKYWSGHREDKVADQVVKNFESFFGPSTPWYEANVLNGASARHGSSLRLPAIGRSAPEGMAAQDKTGRLTAEVKKLLEELQTKGDGKRAKDIRENARGALLKIAHENPGLVLDAFEGAIRKPDAARGILTSARSYIRGQLGFAGKLPENSGIKAAWMGGERSEDKPQAAPDSAMSAEKRLQKALDIIESSQAILVSLSKSGCFTGDLYRAVCNEVAPEMADTAERDLEALADRDLLLQMRGNDFRPTDEFKFLRAKLSRMAAGLEAASVSPLAELMNSPLMQDFLYGRPNEARQIIRAFFGKRLLNAIDASDDNTLLVFSEKAAFGEVRENEGRTETVPGLAPFIKKLALSGLKVAVVAPTEKQRKLIAELNEDIKDEDAKIGCAESISDIERVRSAKRAPRISYYKVVGELSKGIPEPAVREITFERIMEILCAVCGIVPDDATMRELKRIGQIFEEMA